MLFFASYLFFLFGKCDKISCSASAIINLSMVSIVDSLLSMLQAPAHRILRCEANTHFIGSGYASSLSFFFLGCRPRFSATQHSHGCALPLVNLKKKRDCSQSTTYNNKSTGCFEQICNKVSGNYRNVADLTSGIPRWS